LNIHINIFHIYTCGCKYICIFIGIYKICMYIHVYKHIYMHTYIHSYMYTYIYICIFIYLYMHTSIHIHTHTHTHTPIPSHTQPFVRSHLPPAHLHTTHTRVPTHVGPMVFNTLHRGSMTCGKLSHYDGSSLTVKGTHNTHAPKHRSNGIRNYQSWFDDMW